MFENIQCIYTCTCGFERPGTDEDRMTSPTHQHFGFGQVWQCDNCKTVWARVRPHRGGDAYIKVSDSDIKFHRLLDKPEEEE